MHILWSRLAQLGREVPGSIIAQGCHLLWPCAQLNMSQSYCCPYLLSHLLIAGCDIGVQISVRPSVRSFVRPFVRSFVRPSTFTSKFGFLDIRDSCESETLHSYCP